MAFGAVGHFSGRSRDKIARRLRFLVFAFAALLPAISSGLTNGGKTSDAISVAGEEDRYTFFANADDNVALRVADIGGGLFWPRVRLYKPSGGLAWSGDGATVAAIDFGLSETGTYAVVVDDFSGFSQTGAYDLYFVLAPGANEGGPLPNGASSSGTIDLGDLDSYTFTATAGQNVALRVADIGGGWFWPRVRLYQPSGELAPSGDGAEVAGIDSYFGLTETGVYTVVVDDFSSGRSEPGVYNLHFVLAPGANENGSLGYGRVVTTAIDLGDLDSYSFPATAGDTISLQVVDNDGSVFWPVVRLYGPSGEHLRSENGDAIAAIARQLSATGTYTVVVNDAFGNQTGSYTLTYSTDAEPNEADVPVPLWAMAVLATLLAAIGRYRSAAAGAVAARGPSSSKSAASPRKV